MLTINELLHEVEKLPTAEKWQFFKRMVMLLEHETQKPQPSDYHEFLRQTYGSLRDTPIQRYDQGDYEKRERLE